MKDADLHTEYFDNTARIMKRSLPSEVDVDPDAEDCMKKCVEEFISSVCCEALCLNEMDKEKTLDSAHILSALNNMGYGDYFKVLSQYISKLSTNKIGASKVKGKLGTGGEASAAVSATSRSRTPKGGAKKAVTLEASTSDVNVLIIQDVEKEEKKGTSKKSSKALPTASLTAHAVTAPATAAAKEMAVMTIPATATVATTVTSRVKAAEEAAAASASTRLSGSGAPAANTEGSNRNLAQGIPQVHSGLHSQETYPHMRVPMVRGNIVQFPVRGGTLNALQPGHYLPVKPAIESIPPLLRLSTSLHTFLSKEKEGTDNKLQGILNMQALTCQTLKSQAVARRTPDENAAKKRKL